jgi:hypothetical protein
MYKEISSSSNAFCAMKPLVEQHLIDILTNRIFICFVSIISVLLLIRLIFNQIKMKHMKYELMKTREELSMVMGDLKSSELLIQNIYNKADELGNIQLIKLIEESD